MVSGEIPPGRKDFPSLRILDSLFPCPFDFLSVPGPFESEATVPGRTSSVKIGRVNQCSTGVQGNSKLTSHLDVP